MRKFVVPLLSFLLGALVIVVALIIYGSTLAEQPNSSRSTPDLSTTVGSPRPPGGQGMLPAQYARAWEWLNAGRAREAQDALLEILSADPEDQHALQGLVAARRTIVGDDPRELRRQAALYQEAITRGADTGDHYTRSAMTALIAASERAAREIEARTDPAPLVPSGTPPTPVLRPRAPGPDKVPSTKTAPPATSAARSMTPQTPTPSAAPVKQVVDTPPATRAPQAPSPPPTPAPHVPPAPAPAAQTAPPPAAPAPPVPAPQTDSPPPVPTPQTAPPPPSVTNRFYMVRVSPVSDRERASAIAKDLVGKGFPSANVTVQTGPLFRVVSEPLPRSVAESLATTLAARGFRSQLESLGGDATHLLFGSFASQEEADTLSQRINTQGYDAWVVREGTAYTLELGPYPQTSVEAITGIIKSSAPDATVTAVPAP